MIIQANGNVSAASASDEACEGGEVAPEPPPPVPTDCASRRLPTGWTRLEDCVQPATTNAGVACRNWEDVFDSSFASTSGKNRKLRMSLEGRKQYVSLAFEVDEEESSRRGNFGQYDPMQGVLPIPSRSGVMVSISSCEADFNKDLIMAETGCYFDSNSANADGRWSAVDAEPYSLATCELQPGVQYYFNIIHAANSDSGDPKDLTVHPNCETDIGCGAQWSPSSADG